MSELKQEKFFLFRDIFQIITHNFWLKFLSLIFSIFLFFIVRSDKEIFFERVATLKIITPPKITVLGGKTKHLNVSVKLENSLFSTPPTADELTGEYIVDQEEANKYNLKISRENFPNLPKQYLITFENPHLEIETDVLQTKKLPVHVVLQGIPDSQYTINEITVDPQEIEVEGSIKEFKNLDFIETKPVVVSGINSEMTTITSFKNTEATSISFPKNSVQVKVTLKKKASTTVIKTVPIEIANHLNSSKQIPLLHISPSVVNIELQGRFDILNQLDIKDIKAYVDVLNLGVGKHKLKILFTLPDGVELLTADPQYAEVNYAKESK